MREQVKDKPAGDGKCDKRMKDKDLTAYCADCTAETASGIT